MIPKISPRGVPSFVPQNAQSFASFSCFSKGFDKHNAKTYDISNKQMSTDRESKTDSTNQPATNVPRSVSALEQIKDQDYEKMIETKICRINRLKESRRKYSKQKLKSKKRDDSTQTKDSANWAKNAKGSFVIPNNKIIRDVKIRQKTEDKENAAPQVMKVEQHNENVDRNKSNSVLVIPRMKSINSKLSNKEKTKRNDNSSWK